MLGSNGTTAIAIKPVGPVTVKMDTAIKLGQTGQNLK
jgi:hypothetical protein